MTHSARMSTSASSSCARWRTKPGMSRLFRFQKRNFGMEAVVGGQLPVASVAREQYLWNSEETGCESEGPRGRKWTATIERFPLIPKGRNEWGTRRTGWVEWSNPRPTLSPTDGEKDGAPTEGWAGRGFGRPSRPISTAFDSRAC